jgi:hypothetical protein
MVFSEFCAPLAGSMKIVLYHGSNRANEFSKEELEKADVVLTTYSILEVDFRKNVMAPKAACAYCGKKFQPERLKVHLRYFCGPYAEKTEAQAKQFKKKMPAWTFRRVLPSPSSRAGGNKLCLIPPAGTESVSWLTVDSPGLAWIC